MFSTNSDIEMNEADAARRGRLAFFKGEREGEAWTSVRPLERFEVVFFGSKTPHLIPIPFCKGRGDKTPACGYLWRPFPRKAV